jgi:HK97 gp10 family phage protein
MAIHAIADLRLARFIPAKMSAKAAILEATQDAFELDIVPTAKELSPVTPEGYQRNVEEKKKRPAGTGINRRSIDSSVQQSQSGPVAQIFTTSGYGGYLELGTSKMRAQPYINPALEMHMPKLIERVKEKIRG